MFDKSECETTTTTATWYHVPGYLYRYINYQQTASSTAIFARVVIRAGIAWPNHLDVSAMMCICLVLYLATAELVSLRISTDTGCAGCRWVERSKNTPPYPSLLFLSHSHILTSEFLPQTQGLFPAPAWTFPTKTVHGGTAAHK